MSSLFDMTGKVALVTGGTKGIGRAIVERYAEVGANVVVSSRTAADCEKVVAEVNAQYGADRAIAAPADLSDPASLASAVDAAVRKWGKIDVVVGNAAAIAMNRFDAVDEKEMHYSLDGNLLSAHRLIKTALPHMRENGGGNFIFVGSTVGIFPSPPFLTYGMAKAALLHMVKILACDLGRENIRVNAICPGLIDTAATTYLIENPDLLKASLGNTPIGRIGKSDEVAAGALLLGSDAGGYITGHVLVIDGGQSHQGREAAISAAY